MPEEERNEVYLQYASNCFSQGSGTFQSGHTAVTPELSGGFAAEQPAINAQPPHTLYAAVAQRRVRNETCSVTNR